ncbi:hypothetical protein [Pseudomonas aeruginosa]|uniref:hypothetical protein n=1 Tax=Pseudomonas aeruginosa TaxID=287 RepID=UPI003204B053
MAPGFTQSWPWHSLAGYRPTLLSGQTLHIDALLRGELTEKQAFDRACKQLEDGRQLASLHGKGLADWKFKKPMLEHRVDEMRDRLQMVLGLEAA